MNVLKNLATMNFFFLPPQFCRRVQTILHYLIFYAFSCAMQITKCYMGTYFYGAFVAERVLEISNLSVYHLKWTMTAFAPVYIKVNSIEIFSEKLVS